MSRVYPHEVAYQRLRDAAPDLFAALSGWDALHADMVAAGGKAGCLPDGLIEKFGIRQVALMDETRAALAKATASEIATLAPQGDVQ